MAEPTFSSGRTEDTVPVLALSPREASKAIGVCEKTLRSKLLPQLRHVRVGQRVVIPIDSLRDWLTTNSTVRSPNNRKMNND